MITLFTTTKNFSGQNKINQINAIQSWIHAPYPTEVIVFGSSEGLEEIVSEFNLIHIKEIETSDNGIPLINHMFDIASKKSSYNICCFLNADIILTRSFFEDVVTIHHKVRKNYLIVGQRFDVDVENTLTFTPNWEKYFFEQYSNQWKLHPPYGSDFFVFPKGQYSNENIPNLLVGRPGWDNWMIYNARKRRMKTIDLSFSTKVIHQNHNYSHKSDNQIVKKAEDNANLQYLPPDQIYTYILTACNYICRNRKLKKNYARENFKEYFLLEQKLFGSEPLYMWKIKMEIKFYKLKKRFINKLLWN